MREQILDSLFQDGRDVGGILRCLTGGQEPKQDKFLVRLCMHFVSHVSWERKD